VELMQYELCTFVEHCMEYNNFNSMFAIISGLGHGSVTRLRQTWDRVPSKWIKLFEVSVVTVSVYVDVETYFVFPHFVDHMSATICHRLCVHHPPHLDSSRAD